MKNRKPAGLLSAAAGSPSQRRRIGILLPRREVLEIAFGRRGEPDRRLVRRDPADRPRDPRGGVVRAGDGAVARRSSRHETHPVRHLLGDADAVVLGEPLRADPVVSSLVQQKLRVAQQPRLLPGEPLRPAGIGLLVGVRHQDDVPRERHAPALEGDHGHQLHDRRALHVQRPPAPHRAVLGLACPGIDPPGRVGRRHHVDMAQQHDGSLAPVARQPRVEIAPAGGGLEDLRGDPLAGQHLLEPAGARGLVARRVHGSDPEVLGQALGRLVAEAVEGGLPGALSGRGRWKEHVSAAPIVILQVTLSAAKEPPAGLRLLRSAQDDRAPRVIPSPGPR